MHSRAGSKNSKASLPAVPIPSLGRLVAAGQRLVAVIKQNEGVANKDLAKFADQINALCDKWQR